MISNNPFSKNRDNRTVEKERKETERRETWPEEKGHESLSVLWKEHWTKDQEPGLKPHVVVNDLNDRETTL